MWKPFCQFWLFLSVWLTLSAVVVVLPVNSVDVADLNSLDQYYENVKDSATKLLDLIVELIDAIKNTSKLKILVKDNIYTHCHKLLLELRKYLQKEGLADVNQLKDNVEQRVMPGYLENEIRAIGLILEKFRKTYNTNKEKMAMKSYMRKWNEILYEVALLKKKIMTLLIKWSIQANSLNKPPKRFVDPHVKQALENSESVLKEDPEPIDSSYDDELIISSNKLQKSKWKSGALPYLILSGLGAFGFTGSAITLWCYRKFGIIKPAQCLRIFAQFLKTKPQRIRNYLLMLDLGDSTKELVKSKKAKKKHPKLIETLSQFQPDTTDSDDDNLFSNLNIEKFVLLIVIPVAVLIGGTVIYIMFKRKRRAKLVHQKQSNLANLSVTNKPNDKSKSPIQRKKLSKRKLSKRNKTASITSGGTTPPKKNKTQKQKKRTDRELTINQQTTTTTKNRNQQQQRRQRREPTPNSTKNTITNQRSKTGKKSDSLSGLLSKNYSQRMADELNKLKEERNSSKRANRSNMEPQTRNDNQSLLTNRPDNSKTTTTTTKHKNK